MIRKSLVAIAAAALAACAPAESDAPTAAARDERQCFFASQVDGFSKAPEGPDNQDRVYITTGPDDIWLVDTWGPCPELDFSLAIGFDPRFAGAICQGDTVDLLVPRPGSGSADRCPVRMIRKLTPEEEAAR